MDPKPAAKIGKYEVLDTLGRGGMGVVYRAIDPRIGRLVAIKMITGDYAKDPDYLNRFYREARSTGTLQHANIVTVYDLGDQDGVPYLVMEYLEGEPLDKIIGSRRDLSLPDRLDIIIQACNGLQYAHQHGVVHRDIKPGNIMVLKDGNVKLVDFGIARLGNSSMTATGQMIGTISYMSPEQINGQAVDSRSDIFSV
jgi:eukaryotic-like serine/threonine-protein kinase